MAITWEDLPNLGDRDFQDLNILVKFKNAIKTDGTNKYFINNGIPFVKGTSKCDDTFYE